MSKADFCAQCGTRFDADDEFCAECGSQRTVASGTASKAAASGLLASPAGPAHPSFAPHEPVEVLYVAGPPPRSGPSTTAMVAVSAAVVLSLAGGAIGYLLGSSGGRDLHAARSAGRQQGQVDGRTLGRRQSYQEGYRRARSRAFRSAYAKARQRAYDENRRTIR